MHNLTNYLTSIRKIYNIEENFSFKEINTMKKKFLYLLSILSIIMLGWFQLEISVRSTQNYYNNLFIFKYVLLNIFTLACLYFFIHIITGRYNITSIIYTFLTSIISAINYYTIVLHGMPFTIYEVKNFITAANVFKTVTLKVNLTIIVIILIFVLMIFVTKFQKTNSVTPFKLRIISIPLIILVMYFGYFSNNPIKPTNTIYCIWFEEYYKYGYTACSIETLISYFSDPIVCPDGYNENKITEVNINSESTSTPDIILILNESFCDISVFSDFELDCNYMEQFYNIDNSSTGYAIVPQAGGGTNLSEYELLTSNSSFLTGLITPFNILDLNGANSIVSHLNSLNYSTVAIHTEESINYSRGIGYPALGFDKCYFTYEFTSWDYLPGRLYKSDKCVYDNMIRWYDTELKNSDAPIFMYVLTMQNHSSWETSDEENNTVHILDYNTDLTDDINEYLTSVKESTTAFWELTEYYKNVDRDVIICMVGDHAPSFYQDIISTSYNQEEVNLISRTTPLIIWSNFNDDIEDIGNLSLHNVIPYIIDKYNLQSSMYYEQINLLREQIPVLTSYGKAYDKDGNIYDTYDTPTYNNYILNYLYMEYNNLSKNRNQKYFELK